MRDPLSSDLALSKRQATTALLTTAEGKEDSRAAIAVDRQRSAFIACDLLEAAAEIFRRVELGRPRHSQMHQ
jgi:hypothetical protein